MTTKALAKNYLLHFLLSILVGGAFGILTVFGQAFLPGKLNSVANLGTVWLCVAFFFSSFANKKVHSAICAIITLLSTVFGYYLFQSRWSNYEFEIGHDITVWSCCAVVGGTIFGIAGNLWFHKNDPLHKLGLATLSSAFLADGLSMMLYYHKFRSMLTVSLMEIIFGCVLILIFERNPKLRMKTYACVVPIVILGIIGYGILYKFATP